MNSKLGTFVSTVLMLIVVMLWSVSILADDNLSSETAAESRSETRELAADANREAVDAAVDRIRETTRLDLDIELVGRTSVQIAGD